MKYPNPSFHPEKLNAKQCPKQTARRWPISSQTRLRDAIKVCFQVSKLFFPFVFRMPAKSNAALFVLTLPSNNNCRASGPSTCRRSD